MNLGIDVPGAGEDLADALHIIEATEEIVDRILGALHYSACPGSGELGQPAARSFRVSRPRSHKGLDTGTHV